MKSYEKVLTVNDIGKTILTDRQTDRQKWIDICRGFGILLVILGHCNPLFNKYIYGFHMPLFFVLSGMVWHQQKYTVALKNNIQRYIVPYIVLCLINLALWIFCCIFSGERYSTVHYIIGILYSRGSVEWMPNCSPLWFLTALFMTLLIVNIIFKIKKVAFIGLAVMSCLTGGLLLDCFDVPKLPWNIDTALVAVFFISVGVWMQNANVLKNKWLIPFLVIVGLIAIYFNPIETVNFDNNEYGNPILMIVGAMGLSLATIIFGYWFGQFDNTLNIYLSWLGRHTIFIMGFDYFIGSVSYWICGKAGLENFAIVFLIKVFLLSLGCVIWNNAVGVLPKKVNRYLRY